MLTDHQHRAQEHKNTRDLGHGGSQESRARNRRLQRWRDCSLDGSHGGKSWQAQIVDSKPWRSARQEPRRTTRTTRQPQRAPHDVTSWSQRGECVRGGTRRVCQGRHAESVSGAARTTVATTTRSRGESGRSRTHRAGQTHRRKGGEAQREGHGVPWWAAHGVP